jgi:hypothetical protein
MDRIEGSRHTGKAAEGGLLDTIEGESIVHDLFTQACRVCWMDALSAGG